jgi:hypothetical protein
MVVFEPKGPDGSRVVAANGTLWGLSSFKKDASVFLPKGAWQKKAKKCGKSGVIRVSQNVPQVFQLACSDFHCKWMYP